MKQTAFPFLFLRGGTSRGPYFQAKDLPGDCETLSEILIRVCGAGHPSNIDGLGGGVAVTTKVAMPRRRPTRAAMSTISSPRWASKSGSSTKSRPAAISWSASARRRSGWGRCRSPATAPGVHAVNTGARVEAVVETPDGAVGHDGAVAIDGVPGTAAPGG